MVRRLEILLYLVACIVNAPASLVDAADASDTPSQQVPTFTGEQYREDLAYLRDVWAPQDKSFSSHQHDKFTQAVEDGIAHADQLDFPDFWIRIAKAVALSGNGHTTVYSHPFPKLPIQAWWFSDGLYIVRAKPEMGDLLGARIEKIGTLTPEQALARIAPLISGNPRRVRALSPDFLETPVLLSRLNISADPSSADLTLRLRNGVLRRVKVPVQAAQDPAEVRWDYWGVLIPGNEAQAGAWLHVLDGVTARPPTYDPATDLSTEWLGQDKRVLYVRSNQIAGIDGNDETFQSKFYLIINNDILQGKPNAVIVDLRLNSGGNYFNSLPYVRALPALLPAGASIFVLVDSTTFSAAIVTAALLKSEGGARVVLVGSAMGDNDDFFAEGRSLVLPNTKIVVGPASGFQDWSKGCTDVVSCYWPNIVYGPKKYVSLAPELPVAVSFSDYATGRDPVLEAALAAASAIASDPKP
jgi:hypothetical protein